MYNLDFISETDFKNHVKNTISEYGKNLESYDIMRFNKNIIDPIKLIFDKIVYQASWDEIVSNEIFRQRDKTSNNSIGYFHQKMFKYIDKCIVPKTGWDVIYENNEGICIEDDKVQRIYVEMKNKHNTMNSASGGKTFMKMQAQLLNDDNCVCFLVEAIAKKSQNIKWEPSVDGKKIGHKRIRRVSIDKFYSLTTGVDDAFHQICMVLPSTIQNVLSDLEDIETPKDIVMDELKIKAKENGLKDFDLSMAMSIYLLGFSSYIGFDS